MIRIGPEDFDVAAELSALGPSGAVVSFTGHVRAEPGLAALALEHYPDMTEREIARHVEDAEARWPLAGVTVIHRTGRLEPGARIVLVAVASAHRRAAFEACEFLMDYLKTRAPFWKREERNDGARWVEAKASDDDAAARWR
ncbi:MAG TPA: molybdenum cofactor biosynthesis protein MoaE [Rhizomicrobium sp.]|nr:molybdenum cofactor biosynthesis protein MoaE [Rhizomicrobium sp.]